MPIKVKEHFRKTKKGLTRVREGSRKDKVKKALVIGASALTTVGLGALAYKRLGSKVVKSAVNISNKADDVAASKTKDITALLTPKKLTQGKQYQTLPDPWLDEATTVSKAKNALTTGKKETKLLTGSKYKAEVIDDPWEAEIIKGANKPLTVSKLKEKPLLLKAGSYEAPEYVAPTVPSRLGRRDKDLAGEIRSQRTLVKREATDIKKANERLELANKYKNSDSASLQKTGANYERAANERLTIISSRSPSRRQSGLVTVRGSNKNSVRTVKTYKPEPPISEVTRIPNTNKDTTDLVTSRRTVLRGLMFGSKQAITKAPKAAADKVKSSIVDTIGDAKWIKDNLDELGVKGDKVYKRRKVLKVASNKGLQKAGGKLKDNTSGIEQAVDIATLRGRALRTSRTVKRQSSNLVKTAKKARAALGDPSTYYQLDNNKELGLGGKIIKLLGG